MVAMASLRLYCRHESAFSRRLAACSSSQSMAQARCSSGKSTRASSPLSIAVNISVRLPSPAVGPRSEVYPNPAAISFRRDRSAFASSWSEPRM